MHDGYLDSRPPCW